MQEWQTASSHIAFLEKALQNPVMSGSSDLRQWTLYLRAVVAQATGDFAQAFNLFSRPEFLLQDSRPAKVNDVRLDLRILATFNILLLLHPSSHPQHSLYPNYLAAVSPYAEHHPNPSVVSALHLLRALQPKDIDAPDFAMHKVKQELTRALNDAKKCKNEQLLAISLSFMRDLIFNKSTTEQALSSSRGAKMVASRSQSKLWGAVADGMYADTLERCGMRDEAADLLQHGEMLMAAGGPGSGVPQALRDMCQEHS